MIRELGLYVDVDSLYQIRLSAVKFLCKKKDVSNVEIPHECLIKEVYKRLLNSEKISDISYDTFSNYFIEADYGSEVHTQFVNKDLLKKLTLAKSKGYGLYLISDIHLSLGIMQRILAFHGLDQLFDGIYISSSLGKSKQSGNIYEFVLKDTNSSSLETVMIGDNKRNDYIKAKENGLHAIHLKHLKHKFRNKLNLFGNDQKKFNSICKSKEVKCRRSDYLFSEYIIHYYFFIERLYIESKKKNIKNLYFLAREGLFLKELFDYYQEANGLNKTDFITTHYLKVSRHSAMLISLKTLDKEKFKSIKNEYGVMSLRQFLESFHFSKEVLNSILDDIPFEADKVIKDFVSSEVMEYLRVNEHFTNHYNHKRLQQRRAFTEYLDSFGVDYKNEGIVLVDVGWGGTMQEGINHFLKRKVNVQGYYIGLRYIYNIEKKTKRFGLNFSVYPSQGFSDYILLANSQLYEQLLAAPHGSAINYTSIEQGFVLEHHEENEKAVYENFISPIQDFMFTEFKSFIKCLAPNVYSQDMAQSYLTDMALRLGLLTSKRKLRFIHQISKGFYQNVGNNKVGLVYNPKAVGVSKKELLKLFLWSPEKIFRYLVKIKPLLYSKGKSWLGLPICLVYYYIRLNRWVKSKLFKNNLI